jgi:carbon-monoxide dehydrogenase medium subunit
VTSAFRLVRPTTAAEAASELARLGDRARLYAGGVELLLLMRNDIVSPDHLVDVKRIAGIDRLEWDGELLRIGAGVTHRRLQQDPLVRTHLPVLAEAERHIGNVRVRNQGTIGGNLCFADPHADPGTALLIHDAHAEVFGPAGERRVELADFFLGTYEVALEPAELLTGIAVRPLGDGWSATFQRIERLYRPTLNVAAAARTESGRIADARLAIGCVGPRPLRAADLEARLRGLTAAEADAALAAAGPELAELLEPVDDILGSAAYKIHLATVLLRRAIAVTLGRAA